MTFNILSGRGYPNIQDLNLDYCGNVIGKYNPDIVGLNEVHNGGIYGNQVEILAKKLGYDYCYFAEAIELDTPYGNAFMSKFPITEATTVVIPDPLVKDEDTYYETRCILNAKIDYNGGINVYVTHMGLAKSEKINAITTLCDLMGEKPSKSILMGDFNMHPDNELMVQISNGLVDTAFAADGECFTYISDNPTEKIDYVFVSDDIVVKNTIVAPEVASDHRAYMCDIQF